MREAYDDQADFCQLQIQFVKTQGYRLNKLLSLSHLSYCNPLTLYVWVFWLNCELWSQILLLIYCIFVNFITTILIMPLDIYIIQFIYISSYNITYFLSRMQHWGNIQGRKPMFFWCHKSTQLCVKYEEHPEREVERMGYGHNLSCWRV